MRIKCTKGWANSSINVHLEDMSLVYRYAKKLLPGHKSLELPLGGKLSSENS